MSSLFKAVSIVTAAMCFVFVACGGSGDKGSAQGAAAQGVKSPESAFEAVTAESGPPLDKAISAAAEFLDENFDAGVKLALINLVSPTNKFSSYALDELFARLKRSGKLSVVAPKAMEAIRREHSVSVSGEASDADLLGVGLLTGAQLIVLGRLNETNAEGNYRITLRVLDAKSGAIRKMFSHNFSADAEIMALLNY